MGEPGFGPRLTSRDEPARSPRERRRETLARRAFDERVRRLLKKHDIPTGFPERAYHPLRAIAEAISRQPITWDEWQQVKDDSAWLDKVLSQAEGAITDALLRDPFVRAVWGKNAVDRVNRLTSALGRIQFAADVYDWSQWGSPDEWGSGAHWARQRPHRERVILRWLLHVHALLGRIPGWDPPPRLDPADPTYRRLRWADDYEEEIRPRLDELWARGWRETSPERPDDDDGWHGRDRGEGSGRDLARSGSGEDLGREDMDSQVDASWPGEGRAPAGRAREGSEADAGGGDGPVAPATAEESDGGGYRDDAAPRQPGGGVTDYAPPDSSSYSRGPGSGEPTVSQGSPRPGEPAGGGPSTLTDPGAHGGDPDEPAVHEPTEVTAPRDAGVPAGVGHPGDAEPRQPRGGAPGRPQPDEPAPPNGDHGAPDAEEGGTPGSRRQRQEIGGGAYDASGDARADQSRAGRHAPRTAADEPAGRASDTTGDRWADASGSFSRAADADEPVGISDPEGQSIRPDEFAAGSAAGDEPVTELDHPATDVDDRGGADSYEEPSLPPGRE